MKEAPELIWGFFLLWGQMKIGSRVELKSNPKMRGVVTSYKPGTLEDQVGSNDDGVPIPVGVVSIQWDSGGTSIEDTDNIRPHIGVGLADKLRGLTLG